MPIVIKADGLAAGKGVVIANSHAEAIEAIEQMLNDNRFGDAGSTIVIEEFLLGEELSYICMVDGENVLPLATSQDHKARDEGDLGPNTGGMGAYSPANGDTPALQKQVMEEVIKPTVEGMNADGNRFCGFLYAGLMIDASGKARVLEFNVRFGDPETQVVLPMLKSDLAEIMLAAISGRLNEITVENHAGCAATVVMASGGYPGSYAKGKIISGINGVEGATVFHAGTTNQNREVATSGGRVLAVTGTGESLQQALDTAYAEVSKITFDAAEYRSDIGNSSI